MPRFPSRKTLISKPGFIGISTDLWLNENEKSRENVREFSRVDGLKIDNWAG